MPFKCFFKQPLCCYCHHHHHHHQHHHIHHTEFLERKSVYLKKKKCNLWQLCEVNAGLEKQKQADMTQ